MFRLGLVQWPMRSLWCDLRCPGRDYRVGSVARRGHAAAGTVARAAGRANVSSISIGRAPTIRLTLHARALR